MQDSIDTVRELSAAELDQVGGGLGVGLTVGLGVDASQELGAVSGVVGQVGGLVSGLVGSVLGAVGGVEDAQVRDAHVAAGLQAGVDVFDDGGQHLAGVGLRDTGVLGDGGDQFGLSGHKRHFQC